MKRCAGSLQGSRKTRKSSSQTHTFSKVFCTVNLHRKYTRALTFENKHTPTHPPTHTNTHTHYMSGVCVCVCVCVSVCVHILWQESDVYEHMERDLRSNICIYMYI
jgi:hypothetical protein